MIHVNIIHKPYYTQVTYAYFGVALFWRKVHKSKLVSIFSQIFAHMFTNLLVHIWVKKINK